MFSISEEENREFDAANDTYIKQQIVNIQEEIMPRHNSNIDRLEPLFPPITLAGITEIVKSRKQKSAGKSEIIKAHIVNLPIIK